jgi:hypothetical protein
MVTKSITWMSIAALLLVMAPQSSASHQRLLLRESVASVRLDYRSVSGIDRIDGIVAGLEATSIRQRGLVESFSTNKIFTIMHDGETGARVVAALQFTAPDVKTFAVLNSRGSDLLRDRVISKMMQTEVQIEQRSNRARVAFSPDNYEFVDVLEDGDDFVIDVVPRRQDELLITGRIWITKQGLHLKRVEGEPAKNPSFWTRRIHFVSEYAPVDGIWLHVRTLARVKMRWFGEYQILSECGPYQMVLAPRMVAVDAAVSGF